MARPQPIPPVPTTSHLQAATLTAACRPTAGGSCCWPSRPCGQGWRRRWPGAPPSTWRSAGLTRCRSHTRLCAGPGSVCSARPPPPGPVLGGRRQTCADWGSPTNTPPAPHLPGPRAPPPPVPPGPANGALIQGAAGLAFESAGAGPGLCSPACSGVSGALHSGGWEHGGHQGPGARASALSPVRWPDLAGPRGTRRGWARARCPDSPSLPQEPAPALHAGHKRRGRHRCLPCPGPNRVGCQPSPGPGATGPGPPTPLCAR